MRNRECILFGIELCGSRRTAESTAWHSKNANSFGTRQAPGSPIYRSCRVMNAERGHGQCDQAELVAVYAVQALPASEVPAIEAHISTCSICSLELAKLRAVVKSFAWCPPEILRPSETLRR